MRWGLLTIALIVAGCDRPAGPAPAASETPPSAPTLAPERRPSETLYDVPGSAGLSRQPVLVVVQPPGQSGNVDGHEVPTFALLDDRTVIARRDGKVVEGTLDETGYTQLLTFVERSGLMKLPPKIRGEVMVSHGASTSIIVRKNGRYKMVEVDGFGKDAMESWATHKPPAAFVSVYRRLTKLPINDAKAWEPKHALITLQSDKGSGEPWPADLPKPGTDEFSTGGEFPVRRYVVPKAKAQAARRASWLKRLESGSAVSGGSKTYFTLGGRRYRVSDVEHTIEARAFLFRVEICATPQPWKICEAFGQ